MTCHILQGSHSMYLADRPLGGSGDNANLTSCQTCHSDHTIIDAISGGITTVSNKTWVAGATTFAGAVANSTLLSDIQGAKAALLNYFADKTKFYGATLALNDLNNDHKIDTSILSTTVAYAGTPTPPASATATPAYIPCDNDGKVYYTAAGGSSVAADRTVILHTPADYGPVASPDPDAYGVQVAFTPSFTATSSMLLGKDWSTSTTNLYLTVAQAAAYYNFMMFIRDHSEGVHNPKYAAQLLYDAQVLVGLSPIPAVRP